MKDFVKSSEIDAAAKFRNRDNGGLLYFRPIALPQLVISILETCFRTNISLSDSMSAYSSLEMCISAKPWERVLWDPENRTMIMKNATLVHLLLMYMYDQKLLKATEIKSLRKRYAKALEMELSNIDSVLDSL